MALLATRELLERERHLHELNLQQKQLSYLLDRCNSYATQATLVTGFSFTSFSAEALQALDYRKAPYRAFAFVTCGALTMALSIGAVGVSSYLTGKAERLAMEVDVRTAVALVRWRMAWIVVPYYVSLLCLWGSAALLVFATCKADAEKDDEELCNISGIFVVLIFALVGGFVTLYPRWRIFKDVETTYASAGANSRFTYEDAGPGAAAAAQGPAPDDAHGMPGNGVLLSRPSEGLAAPLASGRRSDE